MLARRSRSVYVIATIVFSRTCGKAACGVEGEGTVAAHGEARVGRSAGVTLDLGRGWRDDTATAALVGEAWSQLARMYMTRHES